MMLQYPPYDDPVSALRCSSILPIMLRVTVVSATSDNSLGQGYHRPCALLRMAVEGT